MLHTIKWLFGKYWRLIQPPTQLELELERDHEFSRSTGRMRLGALERERQAAANLRFR